MIMHQAILAAQSLILTMSTASHLATFNHIIDDFVTYILDVHRIESSNWESSIVGSILGICSGSLKQFHYTLSNLLPQILELSKQPKYRSGINLKFILLILQSSVKARDALLKTSHLAESKNMHVFL